MYWQYTTREDRNWSWQLDSGQAPLLLDTCYGNGPPFPMASSHPEMERSSCNYLGEEEQQVKRPMNSFLLWAKVMRKKVAKDNPTMHNAQVSKLLGKVWNDMSTVEKRPFIEKAERLRAVHMREHPNYRYAPKKKKDRRAAQKVISPEIAAAFHNAFFDLKSMSANAAAAKVERNDLDLAQTNVDAILPSLKEVPGRETQQGLDLNSTGREYFGNEDFTSMYFNSLLEAQAESSNIRSDCCHGEYNERSNSGAVNYFTGDGYHVSNPNAEIQRNHQSSSNSCINDWNQPSPACSDDYSIYGPSSPESGLNDDVPVPTTLTKSIEGSTAYERNILARFDDSAFLGDFTDMIVAELCDNQIAYAGAF